MQDTVEIRRVYEFQNLQSSVVAHLRWGGNLYDRFCKLVYTCQSYDEKSDVFIDVLSGFCLQEPMKSRAPQLHLEYRFYKQLGQAG